MNDLLTLHFTGWIDIFCWALLYFMGCWKFFSLTSTGAEKLGKWIIDKVEGKK